VLFNHDLPWNPMDVEQRIGRIHRYGQQHTAQVYNLVSADTIEGRIFLMLEEKLLAIGKALGKVNEYGQVTEDLREQVLGQLSERLSYDKLYQDALKDPTLRRTRQELEVALENARTARQVVFELFQDLDSFRLDDYKQFDDSGKGMERRRPAAPFHEPGAGQGRRQPLALGLGTPRCSPADGRPSAASGRGEKSCRPAFGRRRRSWCRHDLARRIP
jgi:superfamily II DNA/RNA helicase